MIKRIVLDLDDVCNSFTMHVLGCVYGVGVGSYDYHKFPCECGYDILGAYHRLKPDHLPDLDKKAFWSQITREVWATLPVSREFALLIGHCENLVGKENVCMLTTPTIDPDCLAGKLEWMHTYLPQWMHRQFLVGPPKHFCARPDTLLIDDRDENCNKFIAAGGHALLVPRPWNSRHYMDTRRYLQQSFNILFAMKGMYAA